MSGRFIDCKQTNKQKTNKREISVRHCRSKTLNFGLVKRLDML